MVDLKHKKIAIVVPCVYDGGGVPNVADYLYEIMDGYDKTIISVSTSKTDVNSIKLLSPLSWLSGVTVSTSEWRGKRVIEVGAVFTELEFMRYFPRRELNQILDQYDLIQVVAGAPAWAMVTSRVNKPVCLQVATLVKDERSNLLSTTKGLKRFYYKLMTSITSRVEKKAIKNVDRIFVENDWMYDEMSEQVGRAKVTFAPPGVDTAVFKPSENHASPLSEKFFISVGRFSDVRKNIRLMFDAMKQCSEKCSIDFKLVLIGLNGPTQEDWEYADNLNIKSNIYYINNADINTLVNYLNSSVAFLSSSTEEGLGIALLEAMACSAPVISTRSGGPETFISDDVNGYLLDIGDVESFSDRMMLLLEDESIRMRLSQNALKTVVEKYSKEITAEKFIGCYEDMLQN